MADIDWLLILSSVNYPAVLAAGAAGFVFGALWFSILGKFWTAALGSARPLPDRSPFGFAALALGANMLTAMMLYGVMLHSDGMSVFGGVFSAVLAWLGFAAPVIAVNHAMQRCSRKLTVIEGGHWLCVFIMQGALMGAVA